MTTQVPPSVTERQEAPAPARPGLPVPVRQDQPIAHRPQVRGQRRRRLGLALIMVLMAAIGGGAYWWLHQGSALPAGIAFSNGRLEADEIDIATKFAGRVAQVLVDEGDHVTAGQVVARIDTRDLEASLAQARAQISQAKHTIAQNQAELVQNGAQLKLAAQELDRARTLVRNDFQTREVLDQRQSQFDAAFAAYQGTQAKIAAATSAMEAAIHNADLIQVNIDDNTLVAPKSGPIQYRLANIGEVLPAGGKVFTMLDDTNVYMDIFLPTKAAGEIKLGDQARILLDAWPDRPIPATVTFIASKNQFTPKMVETRSERDKLMFRVRVRIDPKLLREHEAEVRSGLPGLAYIRFNPKAEWPPFLEPKNAS